MSKTLDKLKAKSRRTIYIREEHGRYRLVNQADATEDDLSFTLQPVRVQDVKEQALMAVLQRDEQVRWAGIMARAGNEALRNAMRDNDHDPPVWSDELSPADQAEDDRLTAIANRVGIASVLLAGMVEPRYEEAQELIVGTAYEAILWNSLLELSGVITDPKSGAGASGT